MKKRVLAGLVLWAAVLLLGATGVFAASTVSFSDSYVEKVATYKEFGESFYGETATGKFKATFTLDLTSLFPATKTGNMTNQFNGETCFGISIGYVSEDFCLGDGEDVKYTTGKTSATVTRKEDIGEDKEKWITVQSTTVKWTSKNKLTITVSGNPAYAGWIMADYYEGEDEPAIEDIADATVTITGNFEDKDGGQFSQFWANSQVTVTGKATTKFVTKGKGDFAEEFELTTVSLTGTGTATIESLIE